MKRNILNNKNWISALLLLLLAACSNETEVVPVPDIPKSYNIRVSVRSGNEQTRASDLIDAEKIKRYDIFIYEPDDAAKNPGQLVKYIGNTNAADLNEISEAFESSTDFLTSKDVFVVVNNTAWDGADMSSISKTALKDTELTCVQNVVYKETVPDSITAFNGYIKDKANAVNEPFVMSGFQEGYNFSDAGNSTLNITLKRTYAKVILNFKTDLDKGESDWTTLKDVIVNKIQNIPNTTRLFDYTPTNISRTSYAYAEESVYKLSANANLSNKQIYPFDTFAPDRLALRLFPHDASGDVNNKATCLFVDFTVGPAGKDEVTKRFQRRINIGDAGNNYRIDPNYAYIITLSYGKTSNSITTHCRIVPWNLLYVEDELEPD